MRLLLAGGGNRSLPCKGKVPAEASPAGPTGHLVLCFALSWVWERGHSLLLF